MESFQAKVDILSHKRKEEEEEEEKHPTAGSVTFVIISIKILAMYWAAIL